MRTLLAANFKAHAGLQREKIVPTLEGLVELVDVIEAKDSTNFAAALDRTNPDLVLLMNEVCSHQTSWRLADACRPRGIRLAVLGRQKSTWPDVIARLENGAKRDSFGEHLRRERMARVVSHFEVGQRCGVAKEVVKQWELDRAAPNRYELQKLLDLFPSLQRSVPPDWGGFYAETSHLVDGPPPSAPEAPEAKTFGEALARERLREGMTQDELAELLDVSGQAVSHWEIDRNAPVLAHYTALLDLFPDLALAPEPPTQDIDKPNGGEGVERAVLVSPPEPKEPPMTSRMPNPVLAASYQPPPSQREKPGDELDRLRKRVEQLEGELVLSNRALSDARAESVTGAAEAMRRLVHAGFMTEAEAAEKWSARIR